VTPVEVACAFGRATGERLLAVERLVLALPQLFKGHLLEVDLAYRVPVRFLVVVARFASANEAVPPSTRDRLAFWAARAGGRTTVLGALGGGELKAFQANLEACELQARAIAPAALFEASARIFSEAGAPADRRRSVVEQPRLAMDATGPGWEAATYDAVTHQLFMAAPLSPPVGDVIALSVRVPGADRPLVGTGKVARVRHLEEAAPGQPAGYALEIAPAPVALHDALVAFAAPRPGDDSRIAPRFPMHGPVQVVARTPGGDDIPDADEATADWASEREKDSATISYADERHLKQDYIENLSQGGAFVRRENPPPVGTPVTLKLLLPCGLDLVARAVVAFARPGGMGLKFELDPETQNILAGAIAQISGRPRRALVVDDDELMCRMLADALAEKGFEVVTAGDGEEGLRVLSEELLALDLLITDVLMPNIDGELFVRTIRKAGGEADLAIVCVTGRLDAALEARLEAAGADAVLDKGLGADLLVRAADAILERKRKARG
jgi:CheY-like chemotaxis protein